MHLYADSASTIQDKDPSSKSLSYLNRAADYRSAAFFF